LRNEKNLKENESVCSNREEMDNTQTLTLKKRKEGTEWGETYLDLLTTVETAVEREEDPQRRFAGALEKKPSRCAVMGA
jgi:hypothetical protein